MTFETAIYIVRAINVALGLGGFIWLLLKASSNWARYPSSVRGYIISLLAFSLASIYGSAETLVQHAEPGLRAFLFLFANVNLLIALWKMRGQHLNATRHR